MQCYEQARYFDASVRAWIIKSIRCLTATNTILKQRKIVCVREGTNAGEDTIFGKSR